MDPKEGRDLVSKLTIFTAAIGVVLALLVTWLLWQAA
jgi:hypothetical protein